MPRSKSTRSPGKRLAATREHVAALRLIVGSVFKDVPGEPIDKDDHFYTWALLDVLANDLDDLELQFAGIAKKLRN